MMMATTMAMIMQSTLTMTMKLSSRPIELNWAGFFKHIFAMLLLLSALFVCWFLCIYDYLLLLLTIFFLKPNHVQNALQFTGVPGFGAPYFCLICCQTLVYLFDYFSHATSWLCDWTNMAKSIRDWKHTHASEHIPIVLCAVFFSTIFFVAHVDGRGREWERERLWMLCVCVHSCVNYVFMRLI